MTKASLNLPPLSGVQDKNVQAALQAISNWSRAITADYVSAGDLKLPEAQVQKADTTATSNTTVVSSSSGGGGGTGGGTAVDGLVDTQGVWVKTPAHILDKLDGTGTGDKLTAVNYRRSPAVCSATGKYGIGVVGYAPYKAGTNRMEWGYGGLFVGGEAGLYAKTLTKTGSSIVLGGKISFVGDYKDVGKTLIDCTLVTNFDTGIGLSKGVIFPVKGDLQVLPSANDEANAVADGSLGMYMKWGQVATNINTMPFGATAPIVRNPGIKMCGTLNLDGVDILLKGGGKFLIDINGGTPGNAFDLVNEIWLNSTRGTKENPFKGDVDSNSNLFWSEVTIPGSLFNIPQIMLGLTQDLYGEGYRTDDITTKHILGTLGNPMKELVVNFDAPLVGVQDFDIPDLLLGMIYGPKYGYGTTSWGGAEVNPYADSAPYWRDSAGVVHSISDALFGDGTTSGGKFMPIAGGTFTGIINGPRANFTDVYLINKSWFGLVPDDYSVGDVIAGLISGNVTPWGGSPNNPYTGQAPYWSETTGSQVFSISDAMWAVVKRGLISKPYEVNECYIKGSAASNYQTFNVSELLEDILLKRVDAIHYANGITNVNGPLEVQSLKVGGVALSATSYMPVTKGSTSNPFIQSELNTLVRGVPLNIVDVFDDILLRRIERVAYSPLTGITSVNGPLEVTSLKVGGVAIGGSSAYMPLVGGTFTGHVVAPTLRVTNKIEVNVVTVNSSITIPYGGLIVGGADVSYILNGLYNSVVSAGIWNP